MNADITPPSPEKTEWRGRDSLFDYFHESRVYIWLATIALYVAGIPFALHMLFTSAAEIAAALRGAGVHVAALLIDLFWAAWSVGFLWNCGTEWLGHLLRPHKFIQRSWTLSQSGEGLIYSATDFEPDFDPYEVSQDGSF